jgi:hypothetical protein
MISAAFGRVTVLDRAYELAVLLGAHPGAPHLGIDPGKVVLVPAAT